MDEQLAIVEIAGRDSVAAAVAAVRDLGFTSLLPTIAFTGTETGDREAPLRAVKLLRRLVAGQAMVGEPVPLSDPALWSAMNARPAAELQARFGVCSPCLACHLYLHLLRIPLAWEHGNAPVITGERETHDGRLKLSQLPEGIDATARVLDYAGVQLLEPVRFASGQDIEALVGERWAETEGQLGCQLSGNYVRADGSVVYDVEGYRRYLAEFFEPIGRAVVDAWRAERAGAPATDFNTIARDLLLG